MRSSVRTDDLTANRRPHRGSPLPHRATGREAMSGGGRAPYACAVKKADRQLIALIGVAICLALLWWGFGGGSVGQDTSAPRTTASALPGSTRSGLPSSGSRTAPASPGGERTPTSGLPTVTESALPGEARHTLALIRAGGPYPYSADDGVFSNREGILPSHPRGYYREYTVVTPGSDDRGARRIIDGEAGDRYYTDDHYASFRQIEEGR